MKKLLPRFVITAMMSCAVLFGNSQGSDTLCFPRTIIEKVLIAAQQKKVLDLEISILNERIQVKEAIIRGYQEKDSLGKAIVGSYERELQIMRDQRSLYQTEVKALNKVLKKQKRKTFWTAMAGVATTTAAIFLFK